MTETRPLSSGVDIPRRDQMTYRGFPAEPLMADCDDQARRPGYVWCRRCDPGIVLCLRADA